MAEDEKPKPSLRKRVAQTAAALVVLGTVGTAVAPKIIEGAQALGQSIERALETDQQRAADKAFAQAKENELIRDLTVGTDGAHLRTVPSALDGKDTVVDTLPPGTVIPKALPWIGRDADHPERPGQWYTFPDPRNPNSSDRVGVAYFSWSRNFEKP